MNNQKKIIIVAGEESGDMYASKIINDFSKENNIKFYGMGSNKMKKTKATLLLDSSNLSVVGFFEILKIYPRLLKALNYMKRSIKDINPDLLILIDYQEFNMKLAKYAKSNGIKVLFYISPQVWAWRENRIKNIKNYIDIMAVIFPFEKKFYENAGIKSYYVGHPLIQDNLYQKNYSNKKDFIGFFPGSRFSEVKNHLPIVNRVIESMNNKNKEYKFLISRSRNINISIYEKYFSNKDYVSIVSNENIYETIDLCKVAVAASGTITLQIALKKIPLCVFYKLSNATYFLESIEVVSGSCADGGLYGDPDFFYTVSTPSGILEEVTSGNYITQNFPLIINSSSSSTTLTVPLKGPCTESVLIKLALLMMSSSIAFLTTIALSLRLSPPAESSISILVSNLPILPKPYKTTS